jgi:RNase P/RNase MRP subunit p30
MASSQNDLIQPFRFRVNRSAFKEQAIEVIQFPWMGKIDAFYKRVEAEFKRKLQKGLPCRSLIKLARSPSIF